MESERGGVPRSSNWSEKSRDAKEENRRSAKLANIQKCQRGTEVFRPHQLLQEVYKRLCQNSNTTTHIGQKGAEVEMGKEAGESL